MVTMIVDAKQRLIKKWRQFPKCEQLMPFQGETIKVIIMSFYRQDSYSTTGALHRRDWIVWLQEEDFCLCMCMFVNVFVHYIYLYAFVF